MPRATVLDSDEIFLSSYSGKIFEIVFLSPLLTSLQLSTYRFRMTVRAMAFRCDTFFHYLLLTDSLSSLQSIRDPESTNPITQRIHIVLQTLSTIQSSAIFIWIPGHIGHPQHDRVDQAAKEAKNLGPYSRPIIRS